MKNIMKIYKIKFNVIFAILIFYKVVIFQNKITTLNFYEKCTKNPFIT